jgi:hypothetical protein
MDVSKMLVINANFSLNFIFLGGKLHIVTNLADNL